MLNFWSTISDLWLLTYDGVNFDCWLTAAYLHFLTTKLWPQTSNFDIYPLTPDRWQSEISFLTFRHLCLIFNLWRLTVDLWSPTSHLEPLTLIFNPKLEPHTSNLLLWICELDLWLLTFDLWGSQIWFLSCGHTSLTIDLGPLIPNTRSLTPKSNCDFCLQPYIFTNSNLLLHPASIISGAGNSIRHIYTFTKL